MRVPTVLVAPNSQMKLPKADYLKGSAPQAGAILDEGVDALATSLHNAKLKLEHDQTNLDKFDLKQTYLDEISASTTEFDQAKQQPIADPGNFAAQYDQRLKAKHEALLSEMQSYGYKPNEIHELALNLHTFRVDQLGKAVAFQTQLQDAKAGQDLDRSAKSLSQYHALNPNATESVRKTWDEQVDLHPYLNDLQREEYRTKGWEVIRTAGAKSLVMSDPASVLRDVDPNNSYAKHIEGPTAAAGTPTLSADTLIPHFVAQESGGSYTAVNKDTGALGKYQVMPATGKGLAAQIGVPWHPELMNKDTEEAKAYQDQIGKAAVQASVTAGGNDPAAIFSHYYSGSTTAYKNPQGNPKTAKYVEDMLARTGLSHSYVALTPPMQTVDPDKALADPAAAYPTVSDPNEMQGPTRADGSAKGMGWLGLHERPDGKVSSEISVGTEINGKEMEIPLMVPGLTQSEVDYLMTHDPDQEKNPNFIKDMPISIRQKARAFATKRVDAGLSPFRGATEAVPDAVPEAASGFHQPTLPALKVLSGDELLTVVAQAHAELEKNNAQDRAAAQVAHENNVASIKATGKPVTPMDEAALVPIVGAVQAHQMIGEQAAWAGAFPFIQTLPMANPAQMQAGLERLKPSPQADPTLFAQQEAVYLKAQEAVKVNREERQKDPVAYIFANNQKVANTFNTAQDRNGRKAAYLALANNLISLGIPKDQWLPMTADQLKKTKAEYQHLTEGPRLAQLENWAAEIPAEMRGNFTKAMADSDGTGPGADLFMMDLFRNHPEYRNFASDYFKGLLQIKEDIAMKPAPSAMNAAFAGDNGAGTAINFLGPTASTYINRATEALYVAAGGRTSGQPGTLVEGLSDPKLYQESFRRAVGGLPGNENTGFFDNKDKSYSFYQPGHNGIGNFPVTILPPKWTKQDWDSRLHSQTLQSLTNNSVEGKPPLTLYNNQPSMQNIIDHGIFVMTAPGGYAIMMPDGGYLKTSTGNNFILKVR